jgi:hypothetical protein
VISNKIKYTPITGYELCLHYKWTSSMFATCKYIIPPNFSLSFSFVNGLGFRQMASKDVQKSQCICAKTDSSCDLCWSHNQQNKNSGQKLSNYL